MLFQGCCLYGDAECILQRIDIDCFLNIGNLILFNRADGGEEITYLQQTGTEIIIRSLIIGRNNERTNFGLGLNVVFVSRLAVLRIELECKLVLCTVWPNGGFGLRISEHGSRSSCTGDSDR